MMSDTPNTEILNLGEEFLKFLEISPEALSKFIDVLKEFYNLQGEIPDLPPAGPDAGPVHLRPSTPDSPHTVLKTIPITQDQLDALADGRANAQVKEKAIEWVKGFLFAVSIMSGGA